ncbi:MAG: DUF4863 family protein [Sandaracinaceae bacterium]
MTESSAFDAALAPVLDVVRAIDPSSADARQRLDDALPLDSAPMQALRQALRDGVHAGTLASRENAGIRFGRVRKAADDVDLSVDCVHMDQPGPGHTHPNGEIDLCFAVSGTPTFDGHPPGWTVYPPGSWHVPTVADGVMDILYFLPGGAIRFEPKPVGAS